MTLKYQKLRKNDMSDILKNDILDAKIKRKKS